jgi:hypothetical protein
MLGVTRFGDYRHNYVVTTASLARRECEHDRLEAADLAGGNDLKNCAPGTGVAGNAGVTYKY